MNKISIIIFTLTLICLPTLSLSESDHDHFEDHQAHKHGYGTIDISYSSESLVVDLSLPAIDVLGFEHQPKNEKQLKHKQSVLNRFKVAENIIKMTPHCNSESHKLNNQDSHHDDEIQHSDVTITYTFNCQTEPNKLSILLFNNYPSIEKIEVKYISESIQKLFTATTNNHTLVIDK